MSGDTPLAQSVDDLDGHTLEELSDYLDRDRTPADGSIDHSPGCQLALASLERLRRLTGLALEREAANEAERGDDWIPRILGYIGLEVRAGRSIPFAHDETIGSLAITEGAVRGLIRDAGDTVGGIVIGRVRLQGDVTVPGESITVDVEASALWGAPIRVAIDEVRAAIYERLTTHTELVVAGVDVAVHDISEPQPPASPASPPDTTADPADRP
ncbi:MAG: hypothetical protein RI885_2792 [Actinomycetota bacterium]